MYLNYTLLKRLLDEYLLRVKNPKVFIGNLPKMYIIEPINYCNLKCPACSTIRIENSEKRMMTMDEYLGIIKQIPENSIISLYHYGESFLHPDIIDMIKIAKSRNMIVYMHSNLNINKSILPEIVSSGIDLLSASIDGASKETYEKFRKKGNYELAWSNFKELDKLREQAKSSFIFIWQFIVNKFNEHEVETAKKLIKTFKSNPRLSLIPMGFRQDMPDYYNYSDEDLIRFTKMWLPDDQKYISDYFKNGFKKPIIDNIRCNFLWDSLMITANGDILPCCFTYQKKHSFGNIFDTPLKEIWNNELYQSSRQMFIDTNFKDCNSVCNICQNFTRIDTKNIFVRNIDFIKWTLKLIRKKRVEINT